MRTALLSTLRELKTLYLREVTHLLRDRHTVIYSVAIPLFLYPTVLFGVFQSMALVKGWRDLQVYTVYRIAAEPQPLIDQLLELDDKIRLDGPGKTDSDYRPDREELATRIRAREIDAALLLEGNVASNVTAEILYSRVVGSSIAARAELEEVLERFREKLVLLRALEIGEEEALESTLTVEERDIASGERKANYVLSLILPLLMVVIVIMGAFYPALDTATGERERRTLETTLIAPVRRSSIVVAKYLAVVSLALLAFALNFASMTFSLKHILLQVDVQSFRIPPLAFVVVVAAAILLAGFISAVMLLVAFLARTFKEGQSYMTPVYLITFLPMAVTLSPEIRLTGFTATLPLVNITLVFREVLQSRFDWPRIVVALAASVVYVALALAISTRIVAREEFLLGEGAPVSWWKRRARARREP